MSMKLLLAVLLIHAAAAADCGAGERSCPRPAAEPGSMLLQTLGSLRRSSALLQDQTADCNGVYEAEDADLHGVTPVVEAGFADFDWASDTGGYIEWTLPACEAGPRSLAFTYALRHATSRPLKLMVNGITLVPSLAFGSTGGWTAWEDVEVTVDLVAGPNTVRLESIGSNGGNFDKLTVSPADPSQRTISLPSVPPPEQSAGCSGVYEVEDAKLHGVQIKAGTITYGDYRNQRNDYIEWTLQACEAGPHLLAFTYALGRNKFRPLKLVVNGVDLVPELAFGSTGDWRSWEDVEVAVLLNAGTNILRLQAIGKSGGNFDKLTVTFDPTLQTIAPPSSTPQPTPPPGETPQCNGVHEAEFARLVGVKAFVEAGFADFQNPDNGFIEWALPACEPGLYSLAFTYALNGRNSRPLRLEVNGLVIEHESLEFPPTGSWSNWADAEVEANLVAGPNTVKLEVIDKSGGNFDKLTVTKAATTTGKTKSTTTPTTTPTTTRTTTKATTTPTTTKAATTRATTSKATTTKATTTKATTTKATTTKATTTSESTTKSTTAATTTTTATTTTSPRVILSSVKSSPVRINSCSESAASLDAKGVAKVSFGSTSLYAGYLQPSSNNQDPVLLRFDNGQLTYCRDDIETTGDDGMAQGILWDASEDFFYLACTSKGTQNNGVKYQKWTSGGWIPNYFGTIARSNNVKVSVLLRIDLATGEPTAGTFAGAILSSGKANTLVVREMGFSNGDPVFMFNSWYGPVDDPATKTRMVCTGSSPVPMNLRLSRDLSRMVDVCGDPLPSGSSCIPTKASSCLGGFIKLD